MVEFNVWKSATSSLLALGIGLTATSPLILGRSASAQLFPSQRREEVSPSSSRSIIIPVDTEIPVEYDEATKILVTPDETMDLTLTVAANITSSQGEILIPYGSEIVGQIEPYDGGSRFVAEELIIDEDEYYYLDGTSEVVTRTEEIRHGASTGDILEGAAIGAAAATVLAAVLGDGAIATEEILGGAGLGALGGWIFGGRTETLISIDPNRDLDVTLNTQLALNNQSY